MRLKRFYRELKREPQKDCFAYKAVKKGSHVVAETCTALTDVDDLPRCYCEECNFYQTAAQLAVSSAKSVMRLRVITRQPRGKLKQFFPGGY